MQDLAKGFIAYLMEGSHLLYIGWCDVNQLIQNTRMDMLVVSNEPGTPKKHSETVFYLIKFNITYIS
jgi:carbamoylphosphate synthase small subunit